MCVIISLSKYVYFFPFWQCQGADQVFNLSRAPPRAQLTNLLICPKKALAKQCSHIFEYQCCILCIPTWLQTLAAEHCELPMWAVPLKIPLYFCIYILYIFILLFISLSYLVIPIYIRTLCHSVELPWGAMAHPLTCCHH